MKPFSHPKVGWAASPQPGLAPGPVTAPGHPLWIGWLEIDLRPFPAPSQGVAQGLQSAVATLDVSARVDIVSLWIGSRTVAVVDRDRLRDWVHAPEQPLRVDDVEFVLVDRQLCLRVDGVGPFPLPTGAVSHLVRSL